MLHAGWNAVVKSGADRTLTITLVVTVGAVISLPLLPLARQPAPESWPFLLLSTAIHVGYFFFLLQAYRVGDLSHVYPIARGAAPLLVAGGAAATAGEILSPGQLAGLLIAALAIASFAFDRGRAILANPRPFLFGFATACFISAYTVTDGLGVRASGSPVGFIAWLFVLSPLPLIAYAVLMRPTRIIPFLRAQWKPGLIGGAMASSAYALVIWALDQSAMAFVSALRETSVVFAVLIGSRLLREPFGGRRLVAAVAVAGGIALMNLAR